MASTIKHVQAAHVILWGREIGAVAWNKARGLAEFEYTEPFIRTGFDVAPLSLPRDRRIFSFAELPRETFHGLPGLLADSLPDRFGNVLIDLWCQRHGRSIGDLTPVERLCYIGTRGMGALEFKPALVPAQRSTVPIEVAEFTELAREILDNRISLGVDLRHKQQAIDTIIRIGASAGGARAKALIAWNPVTGEVRSGQVPVPPGFEPWILKFDGVQDQMLGDPKGYGRIEFAYHRMATECGIKMMPCRLLEEGGRAHFMTKRFDRGPNNEKLHMLSLCGLAHYDFNASGAYSYEQAFAVILRLNLGHPALQELYRRMVFNAVARNQDDHTRNIAFIMDQSGKWQLAPAFDIIWAYNPDGRWTNVHQMRINGKQDGFIRGDLLSIGAAYGIQSDKEIVEQVVETVSRWPAFAAEASISQEMQQAVGASHRLSVSSR
ncbi:MAG: type II toxin-antitoxin system HipA family toxin [Ignavibacteria bacterium]|nr:type II toxin-antitoxin system HipA family toxin [Ignavibacteria bacterium]